MSYYRISQRRVQVITYVREVEADSVEAALALVAEGTEWPTSYDDRGGEILEADEPVVTLLGPSEEAYNAWEQEPNTGFRLDNRMHTDEQLAEENRNNEAHTQRLADEAAALGQTVAEMLADRDATWKAQTERKNAAWAESLTSADGADVASIANDDYLDDALTAKPILDDVLANAILEALKPGGNRVELRTRADVDAWFAQLPRTLCRE